MPDALACPGCLKRFAWTPKVAGKRVTCHCGQKFIAPAAPGGEVVPIYETQAPRREAEPYELADDDGSEHPASETRSTPHRAARHQDRIKCPDCNGPIKPEAVVCVNCGFDLASGRKLQTQAATLPPDLASAAAPAPVADPGGARSTARPIDPLSLGTSPIARALANREDEVQLSPVREFYAPMVMIVLGVIGVAAVSIYGTTSALEALRDFGLNALGAFLSTAGVFLGMTVAVGLLGMAFGELKAALLKVLGIGLLGSSAADTLTLLALPLVLFLGPQGIIGILCVYGALNAFLVGAPLWALFDLEFYEVAAVTVAIGLLKGIGLILIVVMFGTVIG
jgi:hypothetical protein